MTDQTQSPAPGDLRQAIARAICSRCDDNPDHSSGMLGNVWRWQDYLDCADAAIEIIAAATPAPAAVKESLTAGIGDLWIVALMPDSVPAQYDGALIEFARAVEQHVLARSAAPAPAPDDQDERGREQAAEADSESTQRALRRAAKPTPQPIGTVEIISGMVCIDLADGVTVREGDELFLSPVAGEPVAWREHVEQRLRGWRQRIINGDGDRLALDDFMDEEAMDDLIDYVCDEYAAPQAPQQAECQECIEQARLLGIGSEREASLVAEVARLQRICTSIHDGLLRGDDDRELIALAAQAWEPAGSKPDQETRTEPVYDRSVVARIATQMGWMPPSEQQAELTEDDLVKAWHATDPFTPDHNDRFARAVIAADRALRCPGMGARKPLTPEQVKAVCIDTGYWSCNEGSRADFINGLRHGEIAHGIGIKPDTQVTCMQGAKP